MWEIDVYQEPAKWLASPERLTTGAGSNLRASCASDGALAFAKSWKPEVIFGYCPFDLDRGTATGLPERITQGPPWQDNPSLAPNGGFIAFASDRSGQGGIWLRELVTAKEQTVAASPFVGAISGEQCLRHQNCVLRLWRRRRGDAACSRPVEPPRGSVKVSCGRRLVAAG